jgi:hypothetical protein
MQMDERDRNRLGRQAWARLLRRPQDERQAIARAALNTLAAEGESLAYVWIRSRVDGQSVRDIAKELRRHGVSISPATVQRYIEDAHQLLLSTIDAILDLVDLDASIDDVTAIARRNPKEDQS